jgi:hypothetical protein
MNPTALVFAILASLAAPALAGSIGVNFTAGVYSVISTANPGIVAGANWNNSSRFHWPKQIEGIQTIETPKYITQ